MFLCLWHIDVHVDTFLFMTYLKALLSFSDLLGFWHDILLPHLVYGHMKGKNYMCHKQKKKIK